MGITTTVAADYFFDSSIGNDNYGWNNKCEIKVFLKNSHDGDDNS